MNLRKKVFIIIFIISLLVIVILYVFMSSIIIDNFNELEAERVKTDIGRFREAISNEFLNLNKLTSDWSMWDDTYAFIEDRNKEYIEKNLNYQTFKNLDIDMMIFFNFSQDIFFYRGFDLDKNEELNIPNSLYEQIPKESTFLQHNNENSSLNGIFLFENDPVMLSSYPIITSKGEGPIRGTIILGRYLNENRFEHLANITHLSAEIHRLGNELPSDFNVAYSNFSENKQIIVTPLNNDYIAGYTIIRDFYENPILILRVNSPRTVYKQGVKSLQYIIASVLMIIVLFFSLMILFLDKLVLCRLLSINNQLSKISAEGEISKRVFLLGNDEISQLAQEINETLDSLNKVLDEQKRITHGRERAEKKLQKRTEESEENRIATLNILEDVEETRRKLAKTYRELKELDRIKVEFMNMAAHELKTPLIPIIGYLDMIIKGEMGKITEKESLLIAFRSAQRLQRLISDILDISKLESNVMKYNVETVDVGTLINNLVESMKPFANEKKIKLISKIDKKLPLFKCDMSRLTEVFENLISNAIKFTNKGEVVVESKVNEKNMIMSVRDTGIGMSKEFVKEKAFEKFQQEDTTERRKYGGTGLGLAICKSIVEHYKGKIWVKSELGKGSTFYVSLPYRK